MGSREGPAEIQGDLLKLTAIPPRAKFPVEVTVVAWQFGTLGPAAVQSAEPVIATLKVKAGE
jgi:hypothetical protein